MQNDQTGKESETKCFPSVSLTGKIANSLTVPIRFSHEILRKYVEKTFAGVFYVISQSLVADGRMYEYSLTEGGKFKPCVIGDIRENIPIRIDRHEKICTLLCEELFDYIGKFGYFVRWGSIVIDGGELVMKIRKYFV